LCVNQQLYTVTLTDGAVDDALDRLVLYPLHNTIYRCLVMNYKNTGQLDVMQEAINVSMKKLNLYRIETVLY